MTEQVDKPAPLRIGLIIDSFTQPRWVRQCLEKIYAAKVATFEAVVKVPPAQRGEGPLLFKLYNRLDRSMFPATPDALEPVSIDELISILPVVASDELEKFNLDVLLNFGPTEWNARVAGSAKYG